MSAQQFIAHYDNLIYNQDFTEEEFERLVNRVYKEMDALGFDFDTQMEIEMSLGFWLNATTLTWLS